MAVVRRMSASQRSEGEVWPSEAVKELRRLRVVEEELKGCGVSGREELVRMARL